jgi:hypothetical protein
VKQNGTLDGPFVSEEKITAAKVKSNKDRKQEQQELQIKVQTRTNDMWG